MLRRVVRYDPLNAEFVLTDIEYHPTLDYVYFENPGGNFNLFKPNIRFAAVGKVDASYCGFLIDERVEKLSALRKHKEYVVWHGTLQWLKEHGRNDLKDPRAKIG